MQFSLAPTLAMASLAILSLAPQSYGQVQVTTKASVDLTGANGDHLSDYPCLSGDGQFVAFFSQASNLVSGDSNGSPDVFVRDIQSGVTELVSVSSTGAQGNSGSFNPSISEDGRLVAFESGSVGLVAGDTNGKFDIFVRDRSTGLTERVSIDSTGVEANHGSSSPSISADGRFVAFASHATNLSVADISAVADIYIHDRLLGVTEQVSVDSSGGQSNSESFTPSVSADGQFIAFESLATNLVANDTNGTLDVFVRDRLAGSTERVAIDSAGNQANGPSFGASISADGRWVAFLSYASNLVPGDTNQASDIFVHDRQTGVTERVSVDSYGTQSVPSHCFAPQISGDGRVVVFGSWSDSLIPGDTNGASDIFVHDRQTGVTELASINSLGVQGNGINNDPTISSDGRHVAFASYSSNLAAGGPSFVQQVFVHDRRSGGPELSMSNVVAGQTASFTITEATPLDIVLVGFSFSPQGTLSTPLWGPLELSGWISTVLVSTDANGEVIFPIGIPPALLGSHLWVQGVDVGMDYPTTPFGTIIP